MKIANLSLRLLTHPASLAAMAVLLINDHWLKWNYPSVLTGKLSDFAGLFFFPFLLAGGLAAFLAVPVELMRLSGNHKTNQPTRGFPDWIGERGWIALAFGITAAWFIGVKTFPFVQSTTLGLMKWLTGMQGQIVMDLGDLIALTSLIPAWLLATRLQKQTHHWKPGKLAYLSLGVAALASLATSAPRIPYVDHVMAFQELFYARYSDGQPAPMPSYKIYSSADNGQTWNEVSNAPQQVSDGLNSDVSFPKVVCRLQAAQECFRINGDETVERSMDGGNTWQVDWQIPDGRKAYMLRSNLPLAGKRINTVPADIALLERGDEVWVMVAMEDEGLLVRASDGKWQRLPIREAIPTPYVAEAPFETIFSLLPENFSILALAYLSVLGLCILGWWSALQRLDLPPDRPAMVVLRPFIVALVIVLVVIVIAAALYSLGFRGQTSSVGNLAAIVFIFFLLPGTPLYLLLGAWMTWRGVGKVATDKRAASHAGWTCLLGPVVFAVLTWAPFGLWAFGLIPVHTAALALSVVLGILALGWSVRRVERLSKETAFRKMNDPIELLE